MRKFLFVMLALTIMAVPAMASVQNVKVSGDIENTYVVRNSFDFSENQTQDVAIMQTRLRVDADLTDKVSATIALINESYWGTKSADDTTGENSANIDLNLAYVTMKEMLYSPLTVTLGRQEFAFGNSFVVDSAGTNNSAPADSGIVNVAGDLTKQTAQDAVRLTFDYDPLTIDLLYSLLEQGDETDSVDTANDALYGINAGYQFNDEKGTMVEGYFWVKDAGDKVYTTGARGSMNVLDGWNLQAEVAMQRGDMTGAGAQKLDRRAYAAQVLSNYMLPFEKTEQYKPVLGLSYTVTSGDKTNSGSSGPDDDYTAWDPMYENQAGGKIMNAIFNQTNMQVIGATLSFSPMEDVMAEVYFDHLQLMKEVGTTQTLVSPQGGTTSVAGSENGEEGLGQEVGIVLTYDYTEDVQFGARAGWFFPGKQFNDEAETAEQLLINAKVAF